MNQQPISSAVAQRLGELRERVNRLDPQMFGETAAFVASAKDVLLAEPVVFSKSERFSPPENWSAAETDCLASLRALSLDGLQTLRVTRDNPADGFLNELKTKIAAHEPVFSLLTERYACPLNFLLASEAEVREYLLMRLMTADRTRLEESPAAVDCDDLLLKLNLIGIQAATTNDLRFLDALNYYYELLPATHYPESQHAWLLVSWFAFYARALNSWL